VSGCERAAQQTPKQAAIQTQPAVSNDSSGSRRLGDTVQIGDPTFMPLDTPNAVFATDGARAARALLEAQLNKDQFIADDPARAYGTPCLNPIVIKTSRPELAFAFVRPRVLTMTPQEDIGSEKTFSVEITRLAVIRRDPSGVWHGAVEVTRDTLTWKLQSETVPLKLALCDFPAHANRSTDANGMFYRLGEPWLPINAANTEIGPKVIWEGGMTWSKLRQLADSVAKLPPNFVVEGNPEPELPIYYRGLCPGEGCEFGQWLACDTVRVLKDARVGSPTVFIAHRGDTIAASTGDVKITQAGKVVFTRVVKVDQEGTHAVFTPADTLYPLIHTGEGFGPWYFRGKEGGGFFFFGDVEKTPDIEGHSSEGFDIVREAKHEWWVKARNKKGQEGWFQPSRYMPGMSPHYEEGALTCGAEAN
jgi:hypothetical protein